ncbi:polyamine-transporting ATPase 13A3 isoform X2 [Aethina tumida]|uniref:polyamine-transporting ATPase 13A3 isoform X2 n=1 Tax=Aethina tumida TaxID=116153 RepID=UPI002148F15F|nr:polyamine-transporting ATPase 13A3 isoform X2 [Aethina tumida]
MVNNFNGIEEHKIQLERTKNEQHNEKFKCTKIQYINFGEDDQMEIAGFSISKLRTKITWLFYILTFGLLRLFFHWYPHLKLIATHSRCSLKKAQKVLITDNYKGKCKSYFVKDVIILSPSASSKDLFLEFYLCDGTLKRLPFVKTIRCKKLTYIWDEDRNKFVKLAGLDKGISKSTLHTFSGYSKEEQDLRRIIYGYNEIVVPVQTILTLLVLEALTPFYMFQLFSLIVWFCEYYYYYTIAIIIMSVFGISSSIIQTRKNQQNLKGTVHSSDKATVSRNGTFEEIRTEDLVPGDVILVPSGCNMQCDAILLNGTCIVNESMLTGESVPVMKNALPKTNALYNLKEDMSHTLYCGTKVIQTRGHGDHVKAVVIRTGYLTTKGELVRSIMYPPPADFKFDQDSYKFIGILSFIAMLGFIYTVVSKSSRNIAPIDILIKALDLITVAVPPALPAAMTVGKLYALNRLKNHKIFCINSRVINVSGSIDCVCFDKTGTLTEDELDMWAVVPVEEGKVRYPVKDVSNLDDGMLIRGMACCHSLTVIDGELCGDPLDVKMFEATTWTLNEPNHSNEFITPPLTIIQPDEQLHHINKAFKIAILKQFQFSSTLQRMSVVTKSSDKEKYDVFCKGSPEMIFSLCEPSSVPDETKLWLNNFTEQGYRVIALATRNLEITSDELKVLHRDEVEKDLEFLGLIILENKLKKETCGAIETLQKAGMKIVMITGDNIQTAIHVAQECGILTQGCKIIEVQAHKPTKFEFASINYEVCKRSKAQECVEIEEDYRFVVTGNSWSNLVKYFPDLVPKIVAKGAVFARMSGSQKQQLVEELKILGYYVAMCGDGANDCGALKAAHVGISLSEAESSVASPFTSKEPNISCTPKVIKEGRAALVTSFGVFKLMLCYSLTEFASVIILYTIDTNLTSIQYLFIDIYLILNFSSIFGLTKAFSVLDKKPPMTSLLSFIPLCSLVFFMFFTIFYQIFSYHFVQTFSWFTPFIYNPNNTVFYESFENYAVFSVSMFQYITMAIVFSKGKPYRETIFSNKIFTFSIFLTILTCSYIVVYPAIWLQDLFELKIPPIVEDRFTFLLIAFLNFLTCFFVEDIVVEVVIKNYVQPKLKWFSGKQKVYVKVLQELDDSTNFPLVEKMGTENGVINKGFENTENVTTRC